MSLPLSVRNLFVTLIKRAVFAHLKKENLTAQSGDSNKRPTNVRFLSVGFMKRVIGGSSTLIVNMRPPCSAWAGRTIKTEPQ